jgi:hypothetical protein
MGSGAAAVRSLWRNWREADRAVRLVYLMVAAEALLGLALLLAGCWPG